MNCDIETEYRKLLLQNLKSLEIKEYDDKYQNQVMTLKINSFTELVDSENRSVELFSIAKKMTPSICDIYGGLHSKLWVVINNEKIYGFIGIIRDKISGFYLIPELRSSGIAIILLDKAETFCKSSGYTSIKADVVHYHHGAYKFYIKNGFEFTNEIIVKNGGKLVINWLEKTI